VVELQDRLHLASEVFLFEALTLAENEGWEDFEKWALRSRVCMQLEALETALDVARRLGEPDEIVAQLAKATTSTRKDADEFEETVRSGTAADMRAEALRQMERFNRRLLALRDARSIEEIEAELVRKHRRMMLSGFSTWCPQAPILDDLTSLPSHALGGLAFSGGGIRSASFCLGVTSALASQLVLPAFHYVSGVSGGGYIASWLTTWCYRRKDGITGVQSELAKSGADSAPVQWIRRYGSYLIPRPGILATDTWTLLVSYLRNWLPIFFVVVMLTSLCLLLPHCVARMTTWARASYPEFASIGAHALVLTCLAIVLGYLALMRYLTTFDKVAEYPLFDSRVPYAVALGACAASIALTMMLPVFDQGFRHHGDALTKGWGWVATGPSFAVSLVGWVLLYALATSLAFAFPGARRIFEASLRRLQRWGRVYDPEHRRWARVYDLKHRVPRRARYEARIGFGRALAGSVVGGLCCGFLLFYSLPLLPASDPVWLTVAGPLLGVFAFGVAEIALTSVVESVQSDKRRAWASRLGGWILGGSVVWTVLCLVSLGSFAVSEMVGGKLAAGILSVGMVAAAVVCGRIVKRPWVSIASAGLVSAALIFAFSVLVFAPRVSLLARSFEASALTLVGMLIVTMILIRTTDVNRSSLHAIYREGLVRTFLGASRLSSRETEVEATSANPEEAEAAQFQRRRPDPATNIDDDDDPKLAWLVPRRGREFGLLLLNAAVNGQSATDVEGRFPRQWPFTFSPLFCGSPASGVGYAPTGSFFASGKNARGMTVGTAAAVSGAAVSPASGKMTHPIRSFLLSILNARLGLWIGNPSSGTVRHDTAKLDVIAFVRDLLGLRARFSPQIHLSDGGHFENLGIYELVRRGCRCIVAIDASCDPDGIDDDLGNAIRRARIDLGIEIGLLHTPSPGRSDASESGAEAEVTQASSDPEVEKALISSMIGAQGTAEPPRSAGRTGEVHRADYSDGASWAVFDINYGQALPRGRILYVKPRAALTDASLPIDVRNYLRTSRSFPHESTTDQFFTEAQMEAYRVLGDRCGLDAYVGAMRGDSTINKFFSRALRRPVEAATKRTP
jgi:Patatin-like phospholipase